MTFLLSLFDTFFRSRLLSATARLLVWLVLALAPLAAAGQVRVSGSVSEAGTGRAVQGAAILVQGSGRGTVADAEGDFRIDINNTDTLVFRAVGFKTRRLPMGGTGLSQLVIQVALMRDSVRLGEVRVTEGRPDRAAINRALRNIKRPSTAPTSAVKRPRAPQPLFPVDSIAPRPVAPNLESPVSLIYEQFSRAGQERRKMAEIQAAEEAEKARKAKQKYNKNFKDSRGYEP